MSDLMLRYYSQREGGFNVVCQCCSTAAIREKLIRDSLSIRLENPPAIGKIEQFGAGPTGIIFGYCRLERADYVKIYDLMSKVNNATYEQLFGLSLKPVSHVYEKPEISAATRYELMVSFGPICGMPGPVVHIDCQNHEERMKIAEALRRRGGFRFDGADYIICSLTLVDSHLVWDINPYSLGRRRLYNGVLDRFVVELARSLAGL